MSRENEDGYPEQPWRVVALDDWWTGKDEDAKGKVSLVGSTVQVWIGEPPVGVSLADVTRLVGPASSPIT